MKTPKEVAKQLLETAEALEHQLQKHDWHKNPKIGWWQDHHEEHPDHYVMYHGTHEKNLGGIAKHGIHSPKSGSTAGWVSMTHDPHTAHAYASMHGGETAFRGAGQKAQHTPHEHRAVVVAHIPKKWAHENMNHHLRGNMPDVKDRLQNKAKYDEHKAAGKPDHEYYQTTELRFKDHIPPHFIKGYMQKPTKPK